MYKLSFSWFITLITTTVVLSACSITEPYILDFYEWFGLKPDNKIEEGLEVLIELKTGENVDLTPSTPEG